MGGYLLSIFIQGIGKGLFFPIWILHLSNSKISLFEIGVLGTLLEIVRFTTEVPFVAFADRYGRKISLLFSAVFNMLAILVFTKASTFVFFVVPILIMGLADSFESGALEAWLADYLISRGREEDLENELRKTYITIILGNIIGAVSISYLYKINSVLPFIISSILFGIAAFVICCFVKESLNSHTFENNDNNIVTKIKSSYSLIKSEKFLLFLAISCFLFSIGLDGIERFYQTFLKSKNFSIFLISNVYIISSFVSILFMLCQTKFFNVKSNPLLLVGLIETFMFLSVLLSAIINVAFSSFIFIVLFFTLEITIRPLLQSYLNKNINSDIRATTLSFFQLVEAVGEIFAGIGIGYIMKIVGLDYGIVISGIFILMAGLIVFRILFNKEKGLF
ncbi:LOW QUALITY PROTEIN: hypothetical protein Calla_0204 [Caldicellulosiruptor acetigenus 6A]|uniref:Major facilitator superfamily (MFS) profile domain-containing protein n=2 Tax=Caldicellulosiruptor acetigenus TaxID=301953 RepID=G2PWE0_9FIRM|nr:LOW QUALITY PROTEIN: hypothetical protein Calla_0204 [Caldicellulosiruptor acetigenus 6A]